MNAKSNRGRGRLEKLRGAGNVEGEVGTEVVLKQKIISVRMEYQFIHLFKKLEYVFIGLRDEV